MPSNQQAPTTEVIYLSSTVEFHRLHPSAILNAIVHTKDTGGETFGRGAMHCALSLIGSPGSRNALYPCLVLVSSPVHFWVLTKEIFGGYSRFSAPPFPHWSLDSALSTIKEVLWHERCSQGAYNAAKVM